MREQARQATIMAFRHRCTKHVALRGQPKMLGKPDIQYSGNFPFQKIADEVSLPRNAELGNHQVAWNFLYRAFDQAWQEFSQQEKRIAESVF